VGSVPTGLARLGGGGVNLVLLDLSLPRGESDERLSHFHTLHHGEPDLPILVLCRAEEEDLP